MSLLESLVSYCVTKGVLVGDGEDSFRDFMPEVPAAVVVIHEYSGDPVSPFTSIVHRSVQVKVRDSNAEAARAKALRVLQAFKSDTESLRVDFSDNLWGQVYIRQLPFKLDQDNSNRVTYCFNLGITTNILE
jgi:hypothetical protein